MLLNSLYYTHCFPHSPCTGVTNGAMAYPLIVTEFTLQVLHTPLFSCANLGLTLLNAFALFGHNLVLLVSYTEPIQPPLSASPLEELLSCLTEFTLLLFHNPFGQVHISSTEHGVATPLALVTSTQPIFTLVLLLHFPMTVLTPFGLVAASSLANPNLFALGISIASIMFLAAPVV